MWRREIILIALTILLSFLLAFLVGYLVVQRTRARVPMPALPQPTQSERVSGS